MKLNGLVASPSFAAWLEGAPLDIGAMLFPGGKPAAAVIYLAHLSDSERQFAVTLFLSKLVTWMRRQSERRTCALVYMDEMFGFCPPTAEPPRRNRSSPCSSRPGPSVSGSSPPPRTRWTSTTRRCPTPAPG